MNLRISHSCQSSKIMTLLLATFPDLEYFSANFFRDCFEGLLLLFLKSCLNFLITIFKNYSVESTAQEFQFYSGISYSLLLYAYRFFPNLAWLVNSPGLDKFLSPTFNQIYRQIGFLREGCRVIHVTQTYKEGPAGFVLVRHIDPF